MNRRRVSAGLLVGIALACTIALAQQATTRPSQSPRAPRAIGVPNLHRDMEAMGSAFKKLKAQIRDSSKNASSLELIAQMQVLTAGVKQLTPQTVQRLPEADRPAKIKEYRGMMLNLLRAQLDLEEHLLAGENDKAAEALDRMDELQKQGHEDYRPKREEREEHEGPAHPGQH